MTGGMNLNGETRFDILVDDKIGCWIRNGQQPKTKEVFVG